MRTPAKHLAIVGAGPAGLAAGVALSSAGHQVTIFEAGLGSAKRVHRDSAKLGVGVGGCGLFSDGKFSFRPSAEKLWTLNPEASLSTAEQWTNRLLSTVGVSTPSQKEQPKSSLCGITQKHYESIYVNLDGRRSIIERLESTLDSSIRTSTRVIRGSLVKGGVNLEIDDGETTAIHSYDGVVYAGGRLSTLNIARQFPDISTRFLRTELGVRIEHDTGVGPLAKSSETDVKLLFQVGRHEARTFCSCRNGEVALIDYSSVAEGVTAYSGRSDGSTGDRSNFGLQVRFTGADGARAFHEFFSVERRTLDGVPYESCKRRPMLVEALGETAGEAIESALITLLSHFPDLLSGNPYLYAPTIEGVGFYPELDQGLRCSGAPIWFAGDASGIFRGNTAALVSGYFTGLEAARFMEAI